MQQDGDIKKLYYTIGEVTELLAPLEVNDSTIRYWETRFPRLLSSRRNRKGNRVYTPRDIELLREIHHLLKVEGFTIKGAQEQLEARNPKRGKQEPEAAILPAENLSPEAKTAQTLLNLRKFLLDLRESL